MKSIKEQVNKQIKQIIIDGVDVSGCEYYNKDDKTCREVNGKYETDICDFDKCENSNCYYKQLKRKEQECNKLYIQLKADEEYHKEEENNLRKIIKNKEERNIELYKENNKLKQTLIEIKEIAEDFYLDGEHVKVKYLAQEILQKISEVLKDE